MARDTDISPLFTRTDELRQNGNSIWAEPILSALNRLQPLEIYEESVFIFSVRTTTSGDIATQSSELPLF